jgi:lipoate-protein ligase A
MRSEAWRLILDGGADAAQNMAIDEAMLEACERAGPDAVPTLRIYGWSPPAYSLGRTQAGVDDRELARLRAAGVEVVRRPTGGDGVLHEHERTYAVVGALGSREFPRGVVATYARISRALLFGLTTLGVPGLHASRPEGPGRRAQPRAVCFERLSGCEIAVSGRKLVGAAQARRRGAFLQHGSIPLRLDAGRLGEMAGRPVAGDAFIDLTRAAGRKLTDEEDDRSLVEGFEREFGARLVASGLTRDEALRAAELRAWRYDSLSWTRDGAVGLRERRWSAATPPY